MVKIKPPITYTNRDNYWAHNELFETFNDLEHFLRALSLGGYALFENARWRVIKKSHRDMIHFIRGF